MTKRKSREIVYANGHKSQAVEEQPRMPRGLSAAEKRVWAWLLEMASESGVEVRRADEMLLLETARTWLLVDSLVGKIGQKHMIPGRRKGSEVKNPLHSVLSAARTTLRSYFALLGLAPTVRQGLDLVERQAPALTHPRAIPFGQAVKMARSRTNGKHEDEE